MVYEKNCIKKYILNILTLFSFGYLCRNISLGSHIWLNISEYINFFLIFEYFLELQLEELIDPNSSDSCFIFKLVFQDGMESQHLQPTIVPAGPL